MTVTILYEDEQVIIVNKPNNVLVHHSYYARNIQDESLLQILNNQLQKKFYPIHRLDRKTSGLLLLAKEKEYVSQWQSMIENNEINKRYLAIVRGHVLSPSSIKSPVKNERGNYKSAHSEIKPLTHFELGIPVAPYPTSRYSLVQFSPITGRTHQLRIHANKISHPIIGDHKYGNRHHNRMFEEQLNLPNLFLHAYSLTFEHPNSGKQIEVEQYPPSFWKDFLNQQFLSVTHLSPSLIFPENH